MSLEKCFPFLYRMSLTKCLPFAFSSISNIWCILVRTEILRTNLSGLFSPVFSLTLFLDRNGTSSANLFTKERVMDGFTAWSASVTQCEPCVCVPAVV